MAHVLHQKNACLLGVIALCLQKLLSSWQFCRLSKTIYRFSACGFREPSADASLGRACDILENPRLLGRGGRKV